MSEFGDRADRKPSADADVARIRMQPQSLEAERSVIGGLLLSADGWDAIAEIVTSGDFYRPEHRAIFRQIERLVDQGEPVDVITVADRLLATGELEAAGGHQYLAELAEQTPTAANIRAYATAVHERAVLRRLILAAQDIANTGFHPEGRTAEELLDEAERRIMQISEDGPKAGGPRGMEPLLTGALERIEELFNSGGDITGLTTGFIDLDGMTSGLQPSDLVIVAGRPSMGKCIVAGSLLVDPDSGARRPIEELVRSHQGAVFSLNGTYRLTRSCASRFVDDGIKPVFRVRTALGRVIETTLTHPFLTGNGWQPLAELVVGDRVAVPRVLPVFGDQKLSIDALKTLAESCIKTEGSRYSLPDSVFRLTKTRLARFLEILFDLTGDFEISPSGRVRLVFAIGNSGIAEQVQHLLLRFGVLARYVCSTTGALVRHELEVSHWESLMCFLNDIATSAPQADQAAVRAALAQYTAANKAEPLPDSAAHYVRLLTVGSSSTARVVSAESDSADMSIADRVVDDLRSDLGLAERAEVHWDSISRQHAGNLGSTLADGYLQSLASSDIYWDRITEIEFTGMKQVYDLTIPELHNFVAQDIFVHNTSFAMNLVENAGLNSSKPILVFSMEMPAEQLVIRMLSSLGRIDQGRVRNGKLEQDDWPKLSAAMNKLKEANIFIDDTPALTPTELRSRARRLAREHGELGMVMVDYLQLMRVAGASEGRTAEISEISRSLKAIAKEFRCPMVALSQLNRSLEQRPNKRPVNSDLRESGAIEQDADVIMFIYRDEVYHEDSPDKGVAEIIIGKQRNGPIGTCKLAFRGEFTRFENLARGHYDDYG